MQKIGVSLDVLLKPFATLKQKLHQRYIALPQSDQRALLVLTVFLFVALLGGLLFLTTQYQNKANMMLQKQLELQTMLQGAAQQINNNPNSALPLQGLVQNTAANMALGIQVLGVPSDTGLTISANSKSYGTIANFLSQLANQGVVVQKVKMVSQPDLSINMTATFAR